jgi:hypothetical protein
MSHVITRDDLTPCPKCQGPIRFWQHPETIYPYQRFVCITCGLTYRVMGLDEEAAVAEWNHRGPVEPRKMTKPFTSCAEWPADVYTDSTGSHVSKDDHDTEAAAMAVCGLLEHDGFGGQHVHYPVSTWVETPDGTTKDVTNE